MSVPVLLLILSLSYDELLVFNRSSLYVKVVCVIV